MRNKWFIAISMGLFFGVLSGCNQEENNLEQLDKQEQILDDEEKVVEPVDVNVKEAKDIDNNNNNDNSKKDDTAEDKQSLEEDLAFDLPFDEKLLTQGYQIHTLPNGFPFIIPYHWILVETNSYDIATQYFEGKFCFDIPLEFEQIANEFHYFEDVSHEHHGENNEVIYTTNFTMGMHVTDVHGEMEYFLDKFDNTCTLVKFSFGGDNEALGEDPDTMISEEELAAEQDLFEGAEVDNNHEGSPETERLLVDSYEETLNTFIEHPHFKNMEIDEVLSIREKIKNGDTKMIHLTNGFPSIFPYEWYLVEEKDEPAKGRWSGTLCTDVPINQMLVKHLDMLADHNADIVNLEINDSPQMNEISNVEFAFNDEYGTGSWHGNTQLYIDRSQNNQMHKCANVSMEFSSDILP